ncbi:nucleoporin complex subunit 54-domain-containing protein [Xylariales sp. AK1849]|nr:nucleoporin complex subunit 54-domain-containing protein [Xylariales sp. AK1849]
MSIFANAAQQRATASSSMFGTPSTNPQSTFGQPNPQNQQQQQQGQNQQPQSTNAFGSSLFSQPQQQQQSTNAFGTSSSAFGQSLNQQNQNQTQQQQQQPTSNTFGTSSLFQQPQAQQQQHPQQLNTSFMNSSQAPLPRASLIWEEGRDSPNQKPVTDQISALYEKWTPNNPNTVFKHYFYNRVDKSRVPFYQPSPAEDQREWEQAVRDKPASDKPDLDYVPALATGFGAIAARLTMQRAQLAQFNNGLHLINTALDNIMSRHDLETSVRAINARRKHALLRQRCLMLASKVQVLRNRGYALDTDEDELKSKLEVLDRGMADPGLSARTEELWSRLILTRGHADTLRNEVNVRGNDVDGGIPEEAEQKAKKLLEYYEKQLQELTKTTNLVKADYEEWEKETNPKR